MVYHEHMRKKIFIDFDGTLFDTLLIKNAQLNIFRDLGFPEAEVMRIYRAECEDGGFNHESFVARFAEVRNIDSRSASEQINKVLDECGKYLYHDSISFLNWLDKDIFEVDLMTFGDLEYQKRKVEACDIVKYFDHVHYTTKKKWEELQPLVSADEKFVFVDDNEQTIVDLREHYPQSLNICIRRHDHDGEDPFLNKTKYNLDTVENFDGVKQLINNES